MDGSTELPVCENEPIHIPGSVQPHGMMLVAARNGMLILQAAGDVEGGLGIDDWRGAPLASLIGTGLADRVAAFAALDEHGSTAAHVAYIGQMQGAHGARLDVSAHVAGLAGAVAQERDMVVVELEPVATDGLTLAQQRSGSPSLPGSFLHVLRRAASE